MPSLKPIRLRGVTCDVVVDDGATEALLRPADRRRAAGDAGEVADRVEEHLRVVTTRLHAEVAAATVGIELVARERRQVDERRRPSTARPYRSTPSRLNSVGPKPNVSVRRAGCRPAASPVSVGGARSLARRIADRLPRGQPVGGIGPCLRAVRSVERVDAPSARS